MAGRGEWQEQGGLIIRNEAVQDSRVIGSEASGILLQASKEFRVYPAGNGELSGQVVFPGFLSFMTVLMC